MRAGVGSWSFPWAIGVRGYPQPAEPLTAFGLLATARELRAGVVQYADNLPLDALPDGELDRIREAAREWDIEVEAGTRGVEPAHLLRYLGIARRLGARLLRTLTHTAESQPGLDQAERWIREALPEFESHGVTLALENYERHSSAELCGLIERIGSPRLGVCLDTVNSLGALETPCEVVRVLGPHTVNLHVKDFQIRRVDTMMGYLVTGCAAGDGRLDVGWVLGELARYGRDVNLIVELWTPFEGGIERTLETERDWAARSVRYLKQFELSGNASRPDPARAWPSS